MPKGETQGLFQTSEGTGDIRTSHNHAAIDSASAAWIQKVEGYGILQGRSSGEETAGTEAVAGCVNCVTSNEMRGQRGDTQNKRIQSQ